MTSVGNRRAAASAFLAGALLLTTAPTSEAATTSGYPSGCGLSVYIGLPERGQVFGTSTTNCSFVVDSIRMESKMYRSRWYGWEQVQQGSSFGTGKKSDHVTLGHGCAGTVHTYKLVTHGAVVVGGKEFTASAYDQLERDIGC